VPNRCLAKGCNGVLVASNSMRTPLNLILLFFSMLESPIFSVHQYFVLWVAQQNRLL
jgi:hypothetical protein